MALVLPLAAISSFASPRLMVVGMRCFVRYSRSGILMKSSSEFIYVLHAVHAITARASLAIVRMVRQMAYTMNAVTSQLMIVFICLSCVLPCHQ